MSLSTGVTPPPEGHLSSNPPKSPSTTQLLPGATWKHKATLLENGIIRHGEIINFPSWEFTCVLHCITITKEIESESPVISAEGVMLPLRGAQREMGVCELLSAGQIIFFFLQNSLLLLPWSL